MTYGTSPIKRATRGEMEIRAVFLIDYMNTHSPVTVRQLFYAATVVDLVGIEKTEAGYRKVQNQVLHLRRAGRLRDWNLPARPHKRGTTANKAWPHAYAAELDAIPPEQLRRLVRGAIEQHLPADELGALIQAEVLERETLNHFIYGEQP